MKLLIDVGNTRLKWRLVDGRDRIDHGALPLGEIGPDLWLGLPPPDRIAGCCVADEAVRAHVDRLCVDRWHRSPAWLSVSAHAAGVRNRYAPTHLGPDRWASVIAAYHLARGAAVAVNAGTAITVDAVDEHGVYRGGIILPGLFVARRALAQQTARLPLADGTFQDFPTTTVDAIQTGVVDAACGAIERVLDRMRVAAMVFISGGDAPTIVQHIRTPARPIENLVLDGLQVLHL